MTNEQAKALKIGDKCRVVTQPEPPPGAPPSSNFVGRIGKVMRQSRYGNVDLDFGDGKAHIWDANYLEVVAEGQG